MDDKAAENILSAMLRLTLDPNDRAAFNDLVNLMQQVRPDFTREYAEAMARNIMEVQ